MVDRHRPRERDHRALGGRIGGQPARPKGRDRGDVDDRPAAAGDHDRDDVLREHEDRADVDVHHPLPLVRILLDDGLPAADADIVVEHVDAAIGLRRRFDDARAVLARRDIGGDRQRRPAFGLDHLDRALGQRLVPVDHDDLRPGARQEDAGRPAVANAVALGAAARDDGDLAGEAHIVFAHRRYSASRTMGSVTSSVTRSNTTSTFWPSFRSSSFAPIRRHCRRTPSSRSTVARM